MRRFKVDLPGRIQNAAEYSRARTLLQFSADTATDAGNASAVCHPRRPWRSKLRQSRSIRVGNPLSVAVTLTLVRMSDTGAPAQDPLHWATERLSEFIDASDQVHVPPPSGVISGGSYRTKAPDDEVVRQWAVVERILTRYLPDWQARTQKPDGYSKPGYRWGEQREAALLCRAAIAAEAEIQRNLADTGPTMMAAGLHPWVWEAARPAWNAGNYDDAIDAAARNVNSRLRSKVSRRDIGEGDLVAQAFSAKPGDEGNPRLRLALPEDLGTRTVASIYAGISAFGRGLFQAVRNPLAHEEPDIMAITEQEALESLAALSLLARWIDRANVHRS